MKFDSQKYDSSGSKCFLASFLIGQWTGFLEANIELGTWYLVFAGWMNEKHINVCTLVFAQILAPRKQGDFFSTQEISTGRSKTKQVGQP